MNIPKPIKIIVTVLVLFASSITLWSFASDFFLSDSYDSSYADSSCNVAGVAIQGALYTYYDEESQGADDVTTSEEINFYLEEAEDTENIEVILLEIDSYGGSPAAAQEIVETMQRYVTKPIVVQIREGGVSAGYYVASAGDYIFASSFSTVGSIGVTMSYLDASIQNQKDGYTYNQISSGKFKDSGNPEKKLTAEEKDLFQRDVDITYEDFVQTVATNRGMEVGAVRELADGSTMLGELAKEKGLIDQVGSYYDVEDYIQEKYGIEPEVCW